MLAERLLDGSADGDVEMDLDVRLDGDLSGGRARARYLTARDQPWIEAAIDRVANCVGSARIEVAQRVADPSPLCQRPLAWRALVQLLVRWHGFAVWSRRTPRDLRTALFETAARVDRRGGEHAAVIERVAQRFRVAPADLERDLYADLPGSQVLCRPVRRLSPREAAAHYNLALAQGLLRRARALQVAIEGDIRPVLRAARQQRVLCVAERAPPGDLFCLRLAGPRGLRPGRHRYDRALAAWLPAVLGVGRWSLRARCELRGDEVIWTASARDPLGRAPIPATSADRPLESLIGALSQLQPRWVALRDVDPVQAGRRIACPDFTLVDPTHRDLPVAVERVGYWTPRYLEQKLETLRRIERPWLLCVDETLAAGRSGSRPEGPILWFRRRLEAPALLSFIEGRVLRGPPRGRHARRAHPAAPRATAASLAAVAHRRAL